MQPRVGRLQKNREDSARQRGKPIARGACPPLRERHPQRQDDEQPDREREPPSIADATGPVVEPEIESPEAEEDRVIRQDVRDRQESSRGIRPEDRGIAAIPHEPLGDHRQGNQPEVPGGREDQPRGQADRWQTRAEGRDGRISKNEPPKEPEEPQMVEEGHLHQQVRHARLPPSRRAALRRDSAIAALRRPSPSSLSSSWRIDAK